MKWNWNCIELKCCSGCGRDTTRVDGLCTDCSPGYNKYSYFELKGKKIHNKNRENGAEGMNLGEFGEEEAPLRKFS